MHSLFSDDDLSKLRLTVQERRDELHLGPVDDALVDRTYTARLVGADKSLVLQGGGYGSAKSQSRTLFGDTAEILHINPHGADLAAMTVEEHLTFRLHPLRRMRELPSVSAAQWAREMGHCLLDGDGSAPGPETLVHACLPGRFIDHTHADAILTLACQKDAARVAVQCFGRDVVFIPYEADGFARAKMCLDAYDAALRGGASPRVLLLERDGVMTWGDTAKESYERMIGAVSRAERFIADHRRTASFTPPRGAAGTDLSVLPRLRGALAKLSGALPERGPMLSCRGSEIVLAFLERHDVGELVERGCATPDHVLSTKPEALLLRDVDVRDGARFAEGVEGAIARYGREYERSVREASARRGVRIEALDPWPRILLVPGLGIVATGASVAEAEALADVYEHSITVITDATEVGTYAPAARQPLFGVERTALSPAAPSASASLSTLSGAIALVTGGASGIGRATALRLLDLGAHVMVVDRNAKALALTQRMLASHGPRVQLLVADVLEHDRMADAVAATVRQFGGLDVVVSNAGTMPDGDLTTIEGEDALKASLDLNLLAHNAVARAAVPVMSAQGRGGCLLFNAGRVAFHAHPGAGPSAVAKSALVALMRQYAIDLGAQGIRANAVNADRIRTAMFAGTHVELRRTAHDVPPEAYFRSNLLQREVTAEDVAEAFAYLARASSTTGCVITVDGGDAAAFPR